MKKKLLLILLLAVSSTSAWAMARKPPLPSQHSSLSQPVLPPLTLMECYALTLQQSETLAMKEVDLEKSWSDFLKASGELIGDGNFVFTHFNIEPQGGSGSSDGGATSNAFRTLRRDRKFVISQPLFQGLREFALIGGAGNLRKQREGEYERARQLLFQDVATAFYAVLKTQKDLLISQEILELYRERIQELSEWEKIGRSRPTEAVTAFSRMKSIEASIAELRGDLSFQKRVLEFLTGVSFEKRDLHEESVELEHPGSLDHYLIDVDTRSDVQAAHHAAKAQFQNIVSAQSELWPDISLDANLYEHRDGFQSGIDWDVLFTIDVPLWTGGTTLGQIKETVIEWKKSKLHFTAARRQAELEIKQSYDLWSAAVARYQAFEEAVKAAEENYTLQKEDYKNSLVSNLDVLDALQSLNDTRLASNRAYYQAREDLWRMKVATGDCCESL